jgi:ribosomal protein S18 acetylase RimI-like enzyme
MIIRECTLEDIDEIFQLDSQWDQENITHDFTFCSREEVVAYLQRSPIYFFVAESDGRIVGYINGSVHHNEKVPVIARQEPYLEIDNVYVILEFRDKGVGSKLMERLLGLAEQHGIESFIVDSVSTDMDKIINFYRGHGFKLWYVQLFK